MTLVRWNPARELATMEVDRLQRMFGEMFGHNDDVMARGDWMPPVDIFQNGNHEIVLKAEVPGLRREDIDLRVENNTLTISGERRRESEVKQEQYHRVERAYGAFSRSFSLPNTVDTTLVRAEYKDGILTVTLPTREEAKPKTIQVDVK